jgi:hypothetical protein
MNGILRKRQLSAVVFLLLCAVPDSAHAQEFVCWPIARGDTAPRLAHRLAGDPAAAYSDAFQIRDPARRLFVPKSQYQRLKPGWQACVAKGSTKGTHPARTSAVAAASAIVTDEPAIASRPLTSSPARLALASAGPPSHLVLATTIGAVILLVLSIGAAVVSSAASRPIPPIMQNAGAEFIHAFARPLVDLSPGAPAVRARLRFVPRKQQLEISLAPGPGRRYPNLVDHKSNVEYDVTRVMRILGARFVVSDRLRTTGKWVIVPIRLADEKQTGVK